MSSFYEFALKQFAQDGLGLVLCPRFFVEEIASGKLVQAFQGFLKERFSAES